MSPRRVDTPTRKTTAKVERYSSRLSLLAFIRSRSLFLKPSSSLPAGDGIVPSDRIVLPVSQTNIDEQTAQFLSRDADVARALENEHKQRVATLTAACEGMSIERICFQRLTLDYRHEHQRLATDIQRWKQLEHESIQERSNYQCSASIYKHYSLHSDTGEP